ncbi:MAG: lysozyme [Gammaproteobacteria bacterium]|nr:lysozyme [Gammaproteobacteria bacterium]|tara:strand:- start:5628 stop:6056 length:429 start_codon:yes stop_codon:yes gene_type:complete
MNQSVFLNLVAKHEGLRLDMYHDTVGVPTIGYGHNLLMPISAEAAMVILEDDVEIVFKELDDRMDWWRDLPEPAQMVVASMVFNMGWPRFSRFKKFIAALEDRAWDKAAYEMEDSLWFQQVKSRGEELRGLMLSCNGQTNSS